MPPSQSFHRAMSPQIRTAVFAIVVAILWPLGTWIRGTEPVRGLDKDAATAVARAEAASGPADGPAKPAEPVAGSIPEHAH